MYFKVKKDSKTGRALRDVIERGVNCRKVAFEFVEAVGSTKYYPEPLEAYGGISAIWFDTPPDSKLWKKVHNTEKGYYPKQNSKAGRILHDEINQLPVIDRSEVNKAVGLNANDVFYCIGLHTKHKEYYGVEIKDGLDYIPPSDVTEITYTKYNRLFPSDK
ncbi:MAG: hypothetical protein N4A72_22075 [Bacteroidales bacterium]|jgi:ribosomal protein L11|nr:hypothetical protein [Bacteroidales bacterium]